MDPTKPSAALLETLRENLAKVYQQIAAACRQAGRSPDSVKLIAVTKYAEMAWIHGLISLGQHDLGENRPQQLISRSELLTRPLQSSETLNWHLIGQLQRNKVRAVLPHVKLIHSVDSQRLLKRIDDLSRELEQSTDVLLQVNISGEESKSGFTPDEVRQTCEALDELRSVHVRGLMTMAPFTDDESLVRDTFRGLRLLRDELQSSVSGHSLTELSMGMSGDFPIAINEGATLIRLGSVLFEGCPEP